MYPPTNQSVLEGSANGNIDFSCSSPCCSLWPRNGRIGQQHPILTTPTIWFGSCYPTQQVKPILRPIQCQCPNTYCDGKQHGHDVSFTSCWDQGNKQQQNRVWLKQEEQLINNISWEWLPLLEGRPLHISLYVVWHELPCHPDNYCIASKCPP